MTRDAGAREGAVGWQNHVDHRTNIVHTEKGQLCFQSWICTPFDAEVVIMSRLSQGQMGWFGLRLHHEKRTDRGAHRAPSRAQNTATSNFSAARHAFLSLPQPHPYEVCYVCSTECPSESQGKHSRPSERIGLTLLPSATRAEEPSKAAG